MYSDSKIKKEDDDEPFSLSSDEDSDKDVLDGFNNIKDKEIKNTMSAILTE